MWLKTKSWEKCANNLYATYWGDFYIFCYEKANLKTCNTRIVRKRVYAFNRNTINCQFTPLRKKHDPSVIVVSSVTLRTCNLTLFFHFRLLLGYEQFWSIEITMNFRFILTLLTLTSTTTYLHLDYFGNETWLGDALWQIIKLS